MSQRRYDLKTADGTVDCYVHHPDGLGPLPAVILYMDGLGLRPELQQMAERLASNGYYVLLPNLYYRAGDYTPIDPSKMADRGPEWDRLMKLVSSVTNERIAQDTVSFLEFLSQQPAAKSQKVGCVGYCMGGPLTLTAAGRFPDRIAAAASFHGANLATDRPDSPHLLADKMRARVYVGVAETDPFLFPGETERLKSALEEAKVNYTMELYPGVVHGFAVPGVPMYDREASERHWQRLLALYRETLL